MKRIFFLLITVHCSLFTLFSQAPQKFNYQAIARDSDGNELADQNAGLRISILQGSSAGTSVYSETHSVTTSSLGLFTVVIGDGTVESGDFSAIDWSSGTYYLKVEMDGTGGTSYQEMGTAQLLSVPYALFAETGTEGPQGPPGPAGTGLNNQGAWSSDSTYDEGDYVFDRSTGDPAINSMWIFQGTPPYSSATQPYQDTDNWVEFQAPSGPPGDPATDDQTLSISGHDLSISGGNTITLPDTSSWARNGDTLYYNGVVGIGTSSPDGKLEVMGDGTEADDEPLFEVKRNDGQTVFAVYPEGVRIYVDTSGTKGTKGGFAVGGFTSLKGEPNEFLRVTPDSVRIYVNDDSSKGTKGGFAVGGFSALKGNTSEYLRVSPDSVRVYVDANPEKGTKGGFAVGGISALKGTEQEFLRVTPDSVRVYVDGDAAKGTKGGFAVGGFSALKGIEQEFLRVTPDSVRVYVDKETTKGTKGGFAVGGFTELKGTGDEYLRVTPDSVRVYIPDDETKGTKGGFAVGGFSSLKGSTREFLRVTDDSTRVYVDTTDTKGTKGGFAVGGISTAKAGPAIEFMHMTKKNYFIGHESGKSTTTGLYNSFIGYKSGLNNTGGTSNAFLGYESGYSNAEGDSNLFVGVQSGYSNTTGSHNSFLGIHSGYSNTSGINNSFVGSYSGYSNVDGNNNSFLGQSTGFNNESGSGNSFIGIQSGYKNDDGNFNSYLGYQTGYNNTTGDFNVFLGYQSGFSNTANSNSFMGYQSGFSNTAGYYNVFIGHSAGFSNQTGDYNTFMGFESGYTNSSGGENVCIGYKAGHENDIYSTSVYIGTEAGYSAKGHANVYLGHYAGRNCGYATNNVYIGQEAGLGNTGNDNVFIGYQAGQATSSGDRNVFIGMMAGKNETGSDRLYIENSYVDKNNALVYGEFDNDILQFNANVGIGVGDPTYKLQVQGNAIFADDIYLRDGSTTSGDILARIYDSDDDGVIDIYKNASIGIRLHCNSTSWINGGNLGIGTSVPGNKLHLVGNITGSDLTITNYVAQIQNLSTETGADGLAIKVGRTSNPTTTNNFVAFFMGNNTMLGQIHGNGSGGVSYVSSAKDFAEYLEMLNANEIIEAGDIVGVSGGKISKNTQTASKVMVVSTAPLILGNSKPETHLDRYRPVAFMGQVPVKVRGKVTVGDYIIASGSNDGTGIALPKESLSSNHLPGIVGIAWEGSSDPGVKMINTAVGFSFDLNYISKLESQLLELKQENKMLSGKISENNNLASEFERISDELEGLKQIISSMQNKQ